MPAMPPVTSVSPIPTHPPLTPRPDLTHLALSEGDFNSADQDVNRDERDVEHAPRDAERDVDQDVNRGEQDVDNAPSDTMGGLKSAAGKVGDMIGGVEGDDKKVDGRLFRRMTRGDVC